MLIFPVIASMSNSVALHDSFPLILWYAYPIGLSTQTCGVYLTVLVSVHRSITLTALKSEETYNIITKCILYTLVMFVIPFVTLIIVNWRIIVALKQSTRMRNRLSSQKSTQSTSMINNFRLLKNAKYSELFGKFGRLGFNPLRSPGLSKGGSVRDRSVTLMLLAIVAIFLCCNCLAFCNNIYEIVRDTRAHIENDSNSTQSMLTKDADASLLDRSQDIFDFSVELSNILISLNSSSSIFVYLVFSSKYRSIIKHCLGLEKRKKINGVAITTAMVAQRALELSFLPDEAEARRVKREGEERQYRKQRPPKLVRGVTIQDDGDGERTVDEVDNESCPPIHPFSLLSSLPDLYELSPNLKFKSSLSSGDEKLPLGLGQVRTNNVLVG
ncbi:hypothetical protein ANCCEY_12038 [Ancylostoma ceylanicum]|uniref:G-protein coupled receptors family 1 profile domain-containing protein n=1 Tax=Ancylostoma ceylanicum TaxID=53326 RepID=A0A0D6LAM0_9BILA|nr:hypothetical protein ANCCEY_12038 [Ancylostoma ceylanicum]